MPKRVKRNTTVSAAKQAGEKIGQAVGDSGVGALRIPGTKNRFAVPSCSIPYHKHIVYLSPSGSRDSCTCPAHTLQRIRPCKHVMAVKRLIKMQ